MFYVYKYVGKNNEVLYVGQTIDLDRRFNEHKNKQWDLEKEKILFAKCKTLSDMNIYEMYYINKLNAKYNTALVYNDLPSFELPELEWKIYDKNYYNTINNEINNKFKNHFNKYLSDSFWLDKIKILEKQFNEENDFIKKKEILIEIRNCKERLRGK